MKLSDENRTNILWRNLIKEDDVSAPRSYEKSWWDIEFRIFSGS